MYQRVQPKGLIAFITRGMSNAEWSISITIINSLFSMTSLTTPRNKMSTLKEDEELSNCSLCLKPFTDPKILPCFHSFCLRCLETYTEVNAHNKKFACPLCGVECIIPQTGLADLQTNFYIRAAQMKSSIAANSVCEVSITEQRRSHLISIVSIGAAKFSIGFGEIELRRR